MGRHDGRLLIRYRDGRFTTYGRKDGMQHRQPAGEITWHPVDASSSIEIVTDRARRLIAVTGGDHAAGHASER